MNKAKECTFTAATKVVAKKITNRGMLGLVCAAVAMLALPSVTQAAITWNVGDGNWDTATPNWLPGPATFTDDGTVDVTFTNTAGGTVNIAPNMSPFSTTVSAASGTYTFSGGPIDSGTLTKSGGGTLTLSGANIYTGPSLVVNEGKVVLDNATVTLSSSLLINTNAGSSVRAILGGTLSLSGVTITRNSSTTTESSLQDTITSGITGNPNVTIKILHTGNNTIDGLQFAPVGGAFQALGTISMPWLAPKSDKSGLTLGGDSTGNTVTSIIGNIDMYNTVRKRGPGTWTLGSATIVTYQNYAGTTIARGNIDPSQYDAGVQVFGGTLVLDYTFSNVSMLGHGLNNTLYLVGGTLQLDRSTGASGSHVEVVTATSLSGSYGTANAQVGWANITRASGSTAKLRMNTITRVAGSGSTVNFGAAGIADCDNANTNGILGTGWATVAGADFAYNSTDGNDGTVNALPVANYTDVQRLAPGTIANGSTTNVRLIEGSGSGGNITLGSATTTINTLNQSASGGTGATTISMAGQTLGTYAILAGSGSGALTIGSTVGDGTLRATASGGELILHNYSSSRLTINSVIANNTSASSLILDGPGTTILAGANTYSGVTKLSGGALEATVGTGLSTATHLQLNGGVFQSSGSFIWANGYNTTAGQFNWTSEDGGGFAARGGKLTVKIGNNAATEQTWAWVVNDPRPWVNQANNGILGPLKFGSATADSEVEIQNLINLNGETRIVDVTAGVGGDFATLSGVIQNSSAVVPAGLFKTGTGELRLSGVNTYNGYTTIDAGTLTGVTGGSCTNSDVTVNANGTLGVRVMDNAKQWSCKSANVSTATGTKLKFTFGTTPSTTLAPLRILNNLVFTGTPSVVVDPANVGAGKTYPLLVVEGSSCPASVPALSGVSGSLAWGSGAYSKTLYLTTPPNGTLISFF